MLSHLSFFSLSCFSLHEMKMGIEQGEKIRTKVKGKSKQDMGKGGVTNSDCEGVEEGRGGGSVGG